MDPTLARTCNALNLTAMASYFGCDPGRLLTFYEELRADQEFLDAVNERIRWTRDVAGFHRALFAKGPVDNVDWFAFERIAIYVAIRHLRPESLLETGVFYGGNTVFALRAIQRNGVGKLISIDYPAAEIENPEDRHSLVGHTEHLPAALRPGFLVPDCLKGNWDIRLGDSLKIIPQLPTTFDFSIHDSEHSMAFVIQEMGAAWNKRADRICMLVDDIDWSNGFFAFCVSHRLRPLLFTDNGKDDLRIRGGLTWSSHHHNNDESFTGRG